MSGSSSGWLFLVLFLSWTTTRSLALLLPPWRGWEQLRHIGPWAALFKPTTCLSFLHPLVLYVDSESTPTATTRLVPLASLAPYNTTTHRRVVALSDTHGNHRCFTTSIPPCDILLHCGDIMQRYGYLGSDVGGGRRALKDFATWLRHDVPQARHKVLTGGNHDKLLQYMGKDAVRDLLGRYAGDTVVYLENELVQVADLVIFASPWSPVGRTSNTAFQSGHNAQHLVDWALQQDKDDQNDMLQSHRFDQVDILMTHAACETWEGYVRAKQVKFWIHGHWHDGRGRIKQIPHQTNHQGCGGISINVASNDMIYRPIHPPVVYDVCL